MLFNFVELSAFSELLKEEGFVRTVRCKDCKHYYYNPAYKFGWCGVFADDMAHPKPDDYCSRGVRKEEETDE